MDVRIGILLLASILSESNGQHPPGVNPQVYQQQGVPQMNAQQAHQLSLQQQQQLAMQQQAMHQQQMAMQQQQQMAMQQQQMGVQQQQMGVQPQQMGVQPQQMAAQQQHPPVHQATHRGHPPPPPAGQQVFNAQQLEHEREHIGEHVGVPVDTSKMTEQELQFHYFKMHDADNNNKLDGCELVKSLIHWHDQANHDPKSGAPMPDPKIFTDAELVAMIDPILQQDDRNKDGFIDYPEFIQAQQASANP